MSDGNLLAELRAWRDEFARSHGYNLRSMVEALRELDSAAGGRIVRGSPRRPEAVPPREASTPNQALQPTGAAISVSADPTSPEAAPAAER